MIVSALLIPGLLLGTVALAAASAAAAPPPRQQHQQQRERPRRSTAITGRAGTDQEFSLAMSVNGTYLALVAVSNGTADLVLQAQVVGRDPGTPAYINITSDDGTGGVYDTSLVLDLASNAAAAAAGCEPGSYGLSVPDLGALYGASENVLAVRDYQEFKFQIDDGIVFHQLTSASQSWFACEDALVGGAPGYFLRWGVFTEGSATPEGCGITSVVQNFNIAAGAHAAGA